MEGITPPFEERLQPRAFPSGTIAQGLAAEAAPTRATELPGTTDTIVEEESHHATQPFHHPLPAPGRAGWLQPDREHPRHRADPRHRGVRGLPDPRRRRKGALPTGSVGGA